LERACDVSSPTCQFPDYPGLVDWKFGFELFRDQPVGDAGEELTTQAQLAAWHDGTGYPTHRRRFDTIRRDLFHDVFYAHARANPRSLPCLLNGFPAPYDKADGSGKLTLCNAANPSFRSIDYHVPTSSSGVADQPGGNVLITLGLWDKVGGVATPFTQASTTLHEAGHNLGLSHGGPLPIPGDATHATVMETNCKPNYQSSMSYLFQSNGLIDAITKEKHINYSDRDLGSLIENNGIRDVKFAAVPLYQPTWFASATSHLALDVLHVTSF